MGTVSYGGAVKVAVERDAAAGDVRLCSMETIAVSHLRVVQAVGLQIVDSDGPLEAALSGALRAPQTLKVNV